MASDVLPFPPSLGVYSQDLSSELLLLLSLLWLLPMSSVVLKGWDGKVGGAGTDRDWGFVVGLVL